MIRKLETDITRFGIGKIKCSLRNIANAGPLYIFSQQKYINRYRIAKQYSRRACMKKALLCSNT